MNEDFPLPGPPRALTVDVWMLDLDRPPHHDWRLGDLLSADERERAERFVFARDAERFRLGRAMLRLGLGWYLGEDPRKIALTAGWRGKPRLAEPSGLDFNVTHCGGLGLIAFTKFGEVGIDVEAMRRDIEAQDIATSNFTSREAGLIAEAGTPRERMILFLRYWTRKEAVLKASGCGILDGLDTVDVSEGPRRLVKLGSEGGEMAGAGWLVRDLEGIEGFAGAVAAAPGDWSIRKWPIDCEDALRRFAARFPGVQ
jgi:4'-phosphopantetheinyl transferase